jgi:tripartite-type tricarboxylate transporter receptor subunit TctC
MLPDVPTFDELGLKDFELTAWLGIVAPGGTPRELVTKLNAAVVAALNDPEVVRRFRTIGMAPVPTTPEQFSALIKSEIDKASKVSMPGDRPN